MRSESVDFVQFVWSTRSRPPRTKRDSAHSKTSTRYSCIVLTWIDPRIMLMHNRFSNSRRIKSYNLRICVLYFACLWWSIAELNSPVLVLSAKSRLRHLAPNVGLVCGLVQKFLLSYV